MIQDHGLVTNLPPDWPSWDIYVDIVGFVLDNRVTKLVFVECKNIPITLSHLSQLIGYSRVALPEHAIIVSPYGLSPSLKSLLVTFRRTDVLQYEQERGKFPKSIVIARWDAQGQCLDASSIISSDINYLGRL